MNYTLIIFNFLFFVFHSLWIILVLFGWMHVWTLRTNLYAILLTALSWFGLGYWYGCGYCICTDWHWQIRRELGYYDQSNNYIHLLFLKLTGINLSPDNLDSIVLTAFLISSALSIGLNFRHHLQRGNCS